MICLCDHMSLHGLSLNVNVFMAARVYVFMLFQCIALIRKAIGILWKRYLLIRSLECVNVWKYGRGSVYDEQPICYLCLGFGV